MKMNILYFDVVLKARLWGGNTLQKVYQKDMDDKIGEAWILSGHQEGETIVKNGPLKGKKLNDLYLNYKELFGNSHYAKFPLLIKILDAQDDLSVQVHPNDEYAKKHHDDYGKNECWYVLDATDHAQIIYGHHAVSKTDFSHYVKEDRWQDVLNYIPVKKDDFFFVPVGTVHAIGKGIKILEVQQSSDVTYRLYDYDRKDSKGHQRELHMNQSLDVMNYTFDAPKQSFEMYKNIKRLTTNQYFTVDLIDLKEPTLVNNDNFYAILFAKDYPVSCEIENEVYNINANETVLITAETKSFKLSGEGQCFLIKEKSVRLDQMYQTI